MSKINFWCLSDRSNTNCGWNLYLLKLLWTNKQLYTQRKTMNSARKQETNSWCWNRNDSQSCQINSNLHLNTLFINNDPISTQFFNPNQLHQSDSFRYWQVSTQNQCRLLMLIAMKTASNIWHIKTTAVRDKDQIWSRFKTTRKWTKCGIKNPVWVVERNQIWVKFVLNFSHSLQIFCFPITSPVAKALVWPPPAPQVRVHLYTTVTERTYINQQVCCVNDKKTRTH